MEGPGLQKLQRIIREARERAAEKKDEKAESDQLSDGGNVGSPIKNGRNNSSAQEAIQMLHPHSRPHPANF